MDCNGLPLGHQGDVLLLCLQVGQLNYLGIRIVFCLALLTWLVGNKVHHLVVIISIIIISRGILVAWVLQSFQIADS